MSESRLLDLSILDSGDSSKCVVFARSGHDIALGSLDSSNARISALSGFRARIEQAVQGILDRPKETDLSSFGKELFKLLFTDDVGTLYNQLPATDLRIQLISNQKQVQELPWEYLQEPNRVAG